jgi:hypothetical protein
MKQVLGGLALIAFGGVAWGDEAGQPCSCPAADSSGAWQTSWYAGASLAQTAFKDWSAVAYLDDGSYTSSAQDEEDAGFRLFGGVGLSKYLAVELGYSDFGAAEARAQSDGSASLWAAGPVSETLTLEAFDLAVLGKLPIVRDTSVVGRLGLSAWDSSLQVSGTTQSVGPARLDESDHGSALLLGAGIEYDGLRSLRLSLAYTHSTFGTVFAGEREAEVGSVALSLAYLF